MKGLKAGWFTGKDAVLGGMNGGMGLYPAGP
jgi:hypothetical protein